MFPLGRHAASLRILIGGAQPAVAFPDVFRGAVVSSPVAELDSAVIARDQLRTFRVQGA